MRTLRPEDRCRLATFRFVVKGNFFSARLDEAPSPPPPASVWRVNALSTKRQGMRGEPFARSDPETFDPSTVLVSTER
jgi:hypothetical protein